MRRHERARAEFKAAVDRSYPNLKVAAKALGIAPSYLCMLLKGQREPSLPMARRIAKVTGLSLETVADATERAA